MERTMDLETRFRDRFGAAAARLHRAPGRVNLIGEHTDYNEGFVMPAAIDLCCWVAAAPRDDRKLVIYSENVDQTAEANLDGQLRPSHTWSDYPIGVAALLEEAGYRLRGANLSVRGEIPLGAGLSSSAAFEVAVGCAMLEAAGYEIDRVRLALLCQRAENEFVGARCGIMDQFISCMGRAGHSILLDCRSLVYRLLPLPENTHLVICNTMVKHELASSEYNLRHSQCEEAVRQLAEVMPHVHALRDVTRQDLEEHRARLTPTLYKRSRHVVTENERVISAGSALEKGDIGRCGMLMLESHRSLRDDYEVSSTELDLMVEIATRQKGVYGARMTGGGFGGCTISLVDAGHAAEFKCRVAEAYHSETGYKPDIYGCHASQGAESFPPRHQDKP